MNFSQIMKKVEMLTETKRILQIDIDLLERQIEEKEIEVLNCKKAKEIINEVTLLTQAKLTSELESIVNVCLGSLPNSYSSKIEYEITRNVTAVSILLERDGQTFDPIQVCGGGIVDLFSFALRLSFISLSNDTFHCIILDEPFKNISKNFLPPICDLLKMLSDKLKLQMIIVSHIPELAEIAKRLFKCEIRNGTTQISVL